MCLIHRGMRTKPYAVGPGEDDRQAATIIANHPVPLDCPLFYFEITVVNRYSLLPNIFQWRIYVKTDIDV